MADVLRAIVLSASCLVLASCAPTADSPASSPLADAGAPIGEGGASADPNAVEEAVPARNQRSKAEIPDSLKGRIELAIEHVRHRDLLVTNAFWTIFHGILAFGDGQTLLDPRSGKRVNAIDYIFDGQYEIGEVRGLGFIPTKYGLDVQMGPTFVGQGHQDQLLGYLVQCGLKADRKIVVFGKEYTVMDAVNHSKMRARVGQELSWTIILLSEYLGTDASWVNAEGERISVADLVKSEVEASVNEAACGGTHRLEGITWALHTHLRRGGKKEGVWLAADEHLKKYQRIAKEYQNPDGTFSTNYFKSPGHDPDPQRRIGTTGHTLEFLAMSMSDEELKEQWVQDAAAALAMLFLENQSLAIESGALYHSVHGLVLYYRRLFPWDLNKDVKIDGAPAAQASRP